MKTIPFIDKIIKRKYSAYDEDRKRNVSILLILDLLLISVMSAWAIAFWLLDRLSTFTNISTKLFSLFESEIKWIFVIDTKIEKEHINTLISLLRYIVRSETKATPWFFSKV